MDGIEKALGDLARLTDRWMRTTTLATQGFSLDGGAEAPGPDVPSRLTEVTEFGDNPGALRMFQYRPAVLADEPALVVVLHGCTQTAAAYDTGSGWSLAADQAGFVLLYPEQQTGNNPRTCFNWFSRRDTTAGRGEAGSIRAMIDWAMATHGIAPGRVFITGLSAGGAMTVAMLALYPDLFAAGAVIAGMPFRAATTVSGALTAMFEGRQHSPQEWGDLVRGASEHTGPWPRLSVWQGDADNVVAPVNAGEIVKQWLDVHALDPRACQSGPVAGYPHRVWPGADGRPVIESWTIAGMGHGTPIDPSRPDGGVVGPFMLDAGISSTARIADFFGLTAPHVAVGAEPLPAAPAAPPAVILLPDAARLPVPVPAPEPAPVIAARSEQRPPSLDIPAPEIPDLRDGVVADTPAPVAAGPEEAPVIVEVPAGEWVTPAAEEPAIRPVPDSWITRTARGVRQWFVNKFGQPGA